jgi:hypothetical protein
VRRLRGGLDDDTGSEEVDDGMGSREIFDEKFWQPHGVSESLRGLGFVKTAQQFIYREATVATGISDVIKALLLRITVAMGRCHHQTIANVIRIFIA